MTSVRRRRTWSFARPDPQPVKYLPDQSRRERVGQRLVTEQQPVIHGGVELVDRGLDVGPLVQFASLDPRLQQAETCLRGRSHCSSSAARMSGSAWLAAIRSAISGPASLSRKSRISDSSWEVRTFWREAVSSIAKVCLALLKKLSRITCARDGHHL